MASLTWTVTHDPLGLLAHEARPEAFEEAAREQGEDVLQVERGETTLDLGWYHDHYRVMVIKNDDWMKPLEESKASNLNDAVAAFQRIIGRG